MKKRNRNSAGVTFTQVGAWAIEAHYNFNEWKTPCIEIDVEITYSISIVILCFSLDFVRCY